MTKDELKKQAIAIRDEKTENANTAGRVGTALLNIINDAVETQDVSPAESVLNAPIKQIVKDGVKVAPETNSDAVKMKGLDVPMSKMITEINVSELFPTSGIGGTNKFTLAEAIKLIPAAYRTVGVKCTFVDTNNDVNKYEYQGATYLDQNCWLRVDMKNVLAQAQLVENASNKALLDIQNQFGAQRVTPEMLSESTKQLINASGGGTITNLADDEDTTSVNGVIKFADKVYNPSAHSGLGRKILRKNIVAGKNVLTDAMMAAENTIYIIQYDYDLNGAEITVPRGCILQFDGGGFSNGKLKGSDLYFCGDYKAKLSVEIRGVNITPDFVVKRVSPIIDYSKIETAHNNVVIDGTINLDSSVHLKSTIKGIDKSSSSLIFNENLNVGIAVQSLKNIEISNLTLEKKIKKSTADNYDYFLVISIINCDNVNIHNNNILGGTLIAYDKIATNNEKTFVKIDSNLIDCDFSNIDGGYNQIYPQKDIIILTGIQNCFIENNIIKGHDINRVFKVTSVLQGGDFNKIIRVCDNIVIDNNIITTTFSDGRNGKQVIDMYIGTKNLSFKFNKCYLGRHANIVENKTTNKYEEDIIIDVKNNYVEFEYATLFIYTTVSEHLILNVDSNIVINKKGDKNLIYLYNCKNLKIINNFFKNLNPVGDRHIALVGDDTTTNGITSKSFKCDATITNNVFDNVGSLVFKNVNDIFVKDNVYYNLREQYAILRFDKYANCCYCDLSNVLYNDTYLNTAKIFFDSDFVGINKFVIKDIQRDKKMRLCGGNMSYKELIKYFDLPLQTVTNDNINFFVLPKDSDKGLFANKPSGCVVGYQYFCTDKQTVEGATQGIMIYHKGNNVWVDALGRIVQ